MCTRVCVCSYIFHNYIFNPPEVQFSMWYDTIFYSTFLLVLTVGIHDQYLFQFPLCLYISPCDVDPDLDSS